MPIGVARLDPLGNEDESSSSSTLWYYRYKGCIYNNRRLTSTACARAHARRVLRCAHQSYHLRRSQATHGNLALRSSKLECSGSRRRGRVDDLDKIVFKLAPRHYKHWDLFVEHGVKPVERAWVPVYSAWDTSLWSMGHQSIDHGHQL